MCIYEDEFSKVKRSTGVFPNVEEKLASQQSNGKPMADSQFI